MIDLPDGREWSLTADGRTYTASSMQADGDGWRDGDVHVVLRQAAAADGSVSLTLEARGVARVAEVCLLDRSVAGVRELHNHSCFPAWELQKSTAVFLRGDGGGVFACYANPFGVAEIDGDHVRLSYRPGLDVAGSFVSDPLVVGRFTADRLLVRDALPGRDLVEGAKPPCYLTSMGPVPHTIDAGEARAVRAAVAARVPWQPAGMRLSHWDWSENLYRLHPGKPDTLAAYERMATLCAELGTDVVLISPGNHHVPTPGQDPDIFIAGGPWQHVMWLGAGEAVGAGQWSPGDALPEGVETILAMLHERGLGAAAYVNPQLLWQGNEDWEVLPEVPGTQPYAPYRFTCFAVDEAVDWLTRTLAEFASAYGLRGYSFDFVFWPPCWSTEHGHAPGPDSKYAQWAGYRRLLRGVADAGLDWCENLIGSQEQMPWGAAGMTHPHPSLGDNQPQWMPAWPDLSQYRTLANYQRRVAHWFRNFALMPSYKVPGQLHHQANRKHDRPVERGWDIDGARYNLLSSLASGPSTVSVCYLPAWDEREWAGMRERELPFYQQWLGWARDNEALLSRLEDLYDEPRPGAVDGTIARADDGTGVVFLANPDFGPLTARVPLDDGWVLRELHPEPGRVWDRDVVCEPHQVAVLEIVREGSVARPARREVAPDGVTATLGPWTTSGDRMTTDWVPGAALPGLLAQLAPLVPPEGDELLDPWRDPSRLRLFPEIVHPIGVDVRMWVDGSEVPVVPAYQGTWEDVKDTDFAFMENNLLGWYADLHDRLLATEDLTRPWRIELAVSAPDRLRGVHVAHLPRRESA